MQYPAMSVRPRMEGEGLYSLRGGRAIGGGGGFYARHDGGRPWMAHSGERSERGALTLVSPSLSLFSSW